MLLFALVVARCGLPSFDEPVSQSAMTIHLRIPLREVRPLSGNSHSYSEPTLATACCMWFTIVDWDLMKVLEKRLCWSKGRWFFFSKLIFACVCVLCVAFSGQMFRHTLVCMSAEGFRVSRMQCHFVFQRMFTDLCVEHFRFSVSWFSFRV